MRALFLLAAALSAPASGAERSFTVTDFNKIRVDGGYKVSLSTGVSPFARASGPADALDSISMDVEGQTLIIRPNGSAWTDRPSGPVSISVGAHDLESAWLNGSGSLAIDRVKAQTFDLAVQGSGAVTIGKVDVDTLKVGMSGSGSSAVGGKALAVTAIFRGAPTFDGSTLATRDATIGAEGTATVSLTATGTAKIDANGPVEIEMSGGPACTVHAQGAASIGGCRPTFP